MLRQASTIAYYTLLEALRNRLMWLLGLVLVLAVGISGFLGELAITESTQVQVALLAALLRFAAVFLMATFVVTSLVREFNDKGLELVLALPLPRSGYVLGKWLGFATLSILLVVLFGGLTLMFAPPLQVALWTVSLLGELWIIAAFSLLCVLTFSQIMAALSATIGFYLLARSMTTLQLIGHSSYAPDTIAQKFITSMLDVIAWFLPRLDDFSRTEWLVHHTGILHDLVPLLVQSAIYITLLIGAALFDVYRKNL